MLKLATLHLRWLAPVSKKLMSILKLCLEVDIDPTTENM